MILNAFDSGGQRLQLNGEPKLTLKLRVTTHETWSKVCLMHIHVDTPWNKTEFDSSGGFRRLISGFCDASRINGTGWVNSCDYGTNILSWMKKFRETRRTSFKFVVVVVLVI